MNVVIDTNIALDLLLFDDAASRPLAAALAAGELRWLATAAMRDELVRVLGYRPMVAWLERKGSDAPGVLAAFDFRVAPSDAAVHAPCRCADPDDQIFIDLAVAHGALLLSKDRAVLSMKKRLAALGVPVQVAISSRAGASARTIQARADPS